MASNENNGNPDHISRESGGPAHNKTIILRKGRGYRVPAIFHGDAATDQVSKSRYLFVNNLHP